MEPNFETLKDWWWLILAIGALVVTFIRYTIKIHDAVEVLQKVAEHDKKLNQMMEQYTGIKDDTEELKASVDSLSESLKTHCEMQKDEFRAINIAIYAMLDILKKIGGNGEAEAAHQKLREHTLGK